MIWIFDILMNGKAYTIPLKVGDGHSESRVTNVSLSKSNHQSSGHSVRGYTGHINSKHSVNTVGSTIGYTAIQAVFLLCRYEWLLSKTSKKLSEQRPTICPRNSSQNSTTFLNALQACFLTVG